MRRSTISRILVAVRAVEAKSLPAVVKAAQLARVYGADMELFHSFDLPLYLDPDAIVGSRPQELHQQLRRHALRRLELIAARLLEHDINVTVSAECDSPAYEAIIRRTLRIKADLIVASSHAGRHRAPWLQLTDWELVRLSPVPVLLIKSPHAYRRPRILAAVDPTHAFAKPVQLDRRILDMGASLSNALRGTLYAVHAFPRIPVEILAPGAKAAEVVTPRRLKDAQKRAASSARSHLDRLLRNTGIASGRRYTIAAHPINAIATAAKNSHSAIVVMGAISRSGLKRILIGNTAERILDALACDVLVVKPLTFRSRIPRATRSSY